jgi:hypothetical protein
VENAFFTVHGDTDFMKTLVPQCIWVMVRLNCLADFCVIAIPKLPRLVPLFTVLM